MANPVLTSWQVPPVESAGGSRSANVPSKPLPAGGIRLKVKGDLNERQDTMPKYVIERESPDAGKSSVEDLRAAAQKSCAALQKLGTDIQWVAKLHYR